MSKHIDDPKKSAKFKALWGILYGHCKISRKTVLFQSFFGMYNDNPKYVSEELRKRYPEIDIIWVISEKNKSELPSYVKTVEYQSREYYKWTYKAAVLVDNMAGVRHHTASDNFIKGAIHKIIRLFAPQRRKRQYNISTWHGTPLKRLGQDRFDQQQSEAKRIQGSCDYMVAGCEFTAKAIKQAHFREFDIPVKMYGTPRNDILLEEWVDIKGLKSRLGLPVDKKIILFAPTYRDDSVENSGVTQMHNLDFKALFLSLNKRFGGEWCFVFRLHHVVITQIDIDKLLKEFGDNFVNGNSGDMAEYLACSDVLLTDYSSSMFDFALTAKPCFLYAPDKQHYENDVRGVYFSMDKLPFPISLDSGGLIADIENFEYDKYRENVSGFLAELGNVEDGRASQRIVGDIKYFIDTGVKR